MNDYLVNKNAQSNGDHEVHIPSCNQLPLPENQLHLGRFSNCYDAVRKAKEYYPQSNGCAFCCSACHTQ